MIEIPHYHQNKKQTVNMINMENNINPIKISDDQNCIFLKEDNYFFLKGKSECFKCDLLSECIKRSDDTEFPFPCLDTNRNDKLSGIFISEENFKNRKYRYIQSGFILLIIIFSILIYFNIL